MSKRRVFVSMPSDKCIKGSNQDKLKWAIVERIQQEGFIPEVFNSPRHIPHSISFDKPWSPKGALKVMRRCDGAVFIGMPRWIFRDRDKEKIYMPSEFCAYEGALAHSLGLPMFVVAQKDIVKRTIFHFSYGNLISEFDSGAKKKWLYTEEFNLHFNNWKNQVNKRYDVFLGYCSQQSQAAKEVKVMLMENGMKVLDWQTDFSLGGNILQQIKKAAGKCSRGIFLFTNDDFRVNEQGEILEQATPRDNVIFEAGYFIQAKGKKNVLIIRQQGAKMPADLGGDIYASFKDTNDITLLKNSLTKFIVNY